MEKNVYKNGQIVSEQIGETLIYYYKSGNKKAEGSCVNGLFEGKWLFYDEQGLIIQEGCFSSNKKNGDWKRYNKIGELTYHAVFSDDKQVQKLV